MANYFIRNKLYRLSSSTHGEAAIGVTCPTQENDFMEAVVKESPILFSGPMVRAILEDRKKQTRRVATLIQELTANGGRVRVGKHPSREVWEVGRDAMHTPTLRENFEIVCPYGVPGDRLWVREAITKRGWDVREPGVFTHCLLRYDASDTVLSVPTSDAAWVEWKMQSKVSPIHMPRWASRITLEIEGVQVERVQEIGEEYALAEGVLDTGRNFNGYTDYFRELWDSINAKRGFGWDQNPWVWALTFKRVSGETSNVPAIAAMSGSDTP